MSSVADLRRLQYQYRYEVFPYIKEWKKNPYTYFKARLYIEASTVLVFFLLKTDIKSNSVTIAYGLLGLVAGFFLAIPAKQTILVAILLFFLKGILDWADGTLARIRHETSITGAILDPYGAFLGALGFQIGLGFYVAQKSEMILFYYLIPLIPLFYAGRLHSYAFSVLFSEYIKSEKIKEYRKKNVPYTTIGSDSEKLNEVLSKKYGTLYKIVKNFLDDRARTVDFVCFLLLLEMFTPIFITWIVFLGFVTKRFLIFSASFYIVAKENWAEKQLENKVEEISRAFAPHK